MSESKALLLEDRRVRGVCLQCGRESNGKSCCPDCAARAKVSRQKSIQKKKEAGICQMSGCNNPAKATSSLCEECTVKMREPTQRKYAKRRKERQCVRCGKPSGDAARCPECAAEAAGEAMAYYYKRKEDHVCVVCLRKLEEGDPRVLCDECRQTGCDKWRESKMATFAHYGGPVCAGCGEDEVAVLEVDHIGGGGNLHRKVIGLGGIHRWLRDNDYPPGYRVLCPTCNKKAHKGIPLPNEAKIEA